MTYFDSCYLAKLYLMEPDSGRVRALAQDTDGLVCCAIGRGEVVATFHRTLRAPGEARSGRRDVR